jgi:peptidoglycan/LPS O-acetylase OafA/YrhL
MPRLDSIQLLRAIAAVAVVAHHALERYVSYAAGGGSAAPLSFSPVGQAGVDLFFVITGFLMVWTSRFFSDGAIAPADFLRRRAVRLVPVYWLYTTVMLALCLAAPQALHTVRAEPLNVIGSYLFIPLPRASDGETWPLLLVGWSLNLEMLFYVVFAAALCLHRSLRAFFVVATICALLAYGLRFSSGHWSDGWIGNPIYAEFLYGMFIGWLAQRRARMPEWLGWTCLAGGLALIASFPDARSDRALTWGLCAFVAVLGAVSIERRMPPAVLLLGDASYSIYLSHLFTVTVALRTMVYLGVPPGIAILASIIVAVAAGVAAYLLIERPLIAWVHRGRGPSPKVKRIEAVA